VLLGTLVIAYGVGPWIIQSGIGEEIVKGQIAPTYLNDCVNLLAIAMAPRKAETTLTFGPIPNFRTTYGYDPASSEETKNAPMTDCQVISGIGGATNDRRASGYSKSPANCFMPPALPPRAPVERHW
jgi:hypothetical protein